MTLKGECSIDEHLVQYELDLNFLNDVEEDFKETEEISGGKYQITLKKKEGKYWERLVKEEN